MCRIEIVLHEYEPKVFVCTEAKVTQSIRDNEINFNGYKIIRNLSTTRCSGGVVVYIREKVMARVVCDWIEGNDNILIFSIENSSFRVTWVALYHSPNSNHYSFLDQLASIYDMHTSDTSNIYVCGDFNSPTA